MRYFYSTPDDEDDGDAELDGRDPGRRSSEASSGGARERGASDDDDADGRDPSDVEDDPALDDDFPLGDGTADTTAVVYCPYCGELNEIAVDPGGGAAQSYVEDCHICCQPWRVTVAYDADGRVEAAVETADE